MQGIDISHWNGAVNFSLLETDFIIHKCCQMSTVDSKFNVNIDSAQARQIKTGCYIYVMAKDLDEARLEAQTAVKAIDNRTMSMWVWLDMEDSSYARMSSSDIWDIIEEETKILEAAGYLVGIYCNKNWYRSILYAEDRPEVFWVAGIPTDDYGEPVNSVRPKGENIVMWQYSFKGSVPGINGNVDLDITLSDYFNESDPEDKTYIIGREYTLQTAVNVRKGPGTNYDKVGYDNLTADGKAHDTDRSGSLDKSTVITCKDVSLDAEGNTWLRCPSGWVCAIWKGDVYIA